MQHLLATYPEAPNSGLEEVSGCLIVSFGVFPECLCLFVHWDLLCLYATTDLFVLRQVALLPVNGKQYHTILQREQRDSVSTSL